MSLLDDVKVAVRVSNANTSTDSELQMWIDAAIADMLRVGIRDTRLGEDPDALEKAAIVCYVKANYGYDIEERAQFASSYRSIVCGLLNSEANIASSEDDD